jgi:hypothetical protein
MSLPLILKSIKQYKEEVALEEVIQHWKEELPHIMHIMKYTSTKQSL